MLDELPTEYSESEEEHICSYSNNKDNWEIIGYLTMVDGIGSRMELVRRETNCLTCGFITSKLFNNDIYCETD